MERDSESDQMTCMKTEPHFSKKLWGDLQWRELRRSLGQDLKELYQFYLDEERREQLAGMRRAKKWLFVTCWIVKSMILKLTPARRVLLLAGMVLSFVSVQNRVIGLQTGFIVLFVVLMLELKDKLLARDELAIGRAVQRALMPARNPSLPGWQIWMFNRPANEVGGDLVDYLRISDDRMGLALGDVAGKGLGAALVMAKLQATLRALAPNLPSFDALGAEMNRIFWRDGLPNSFSSLIYLELEPESGTVHVLNAGHIPPIVLKDGELKEMQRGAPALGLMPDTEYKEMSIELQPDDLIVIYSDGLTDSCDESGSFFGAERLLAMLPGLCGLSARAVGARLLREVDTFAGEAKPADDLSLIVLKRSSMVACGAA